MKKTFANFVDLGPFMKVFSTKRAWPLWVLSPMHILYYTIQYIRSPVVGVSSPISGL